MSFALFDFQISRAKETIYIAGKSTHNDWPEASVPVSISRAQESTNQTASKVTNTIYVRASGSVDPAEAPISRKGNTYTLTGNITANSTDGIVIERNDIILNGAGFSLCGKEFVGINGINLTSVSNVTVMNISIESFHNGVFEFSSSKCHIAETNLFFNDYGIYLQSSNFNTVEGNNMANNTYAGIWLRLSQYNNISKNALASNIAYNGVGGIKLQDFSNYNRIIDNYLTSNTWYGIYVENSASNHIFHNNFINNRHQAFVDEISWNNAWDDGYPSGGNYWNDNLGVDNRSGPHQNETGSDGIGDAPYVVDTRNLDNYPLIHPWKMGDTNYDGNIDALDLIVVAIALGTKPGDKKWNPRADVKEDSVINVLDLIVVTVHLGT
jgi:parallel beta-helix repeat protein